MPVHHIGGSTTGDTVALGFAEMVIAQIEANRSERMFRVIGQ